MVKIWQLISTPSGGGGSHGTTGTVVNPALAASGSFGGNYWADLIVSSSDNVVARRTVVITLKSSEIRHEDGGTVCPLSAIKLATTLHRLRHVTPATASSVEDEHCNYGLAWIIVQQTW